jgi:hypothetical protein
MKAKVARWVVTAVALVWFTTWASSLVVALRDHSREVLPADGHGTLEAAYLILVAISQPLGLLAGPIVGALAPSGKTGIVLFWLVAGLFGVLQWIGILALGRALWRQFRPTQTSLRIR